jgi:hypothetical protein
MAGAWTTIPCEDADGVARNMRVYDEDGAGTALSWGRREVRGDDGANWSYPAALGGILNTTDAVTIKSAPGAGIRAYVKSMQIVTEALGTATDFSIRDVESTHVLWRIRLPTSVTIMTVTFDPPLKGTANSALEAKTSTATGTGAVYVNVQGFTAA